MLTQDKTNENGVKTDHGDVEIDWNRTVKCASYGAFVIGPLLAVWYPFLDRTLKSPKLMLEKRYGLWAIPIAKVLADELVAEPPLLLCFYSYMNVFEGGSMETLKQKLDKEFFSSWYREDEKIWRDSASYPIQVLGLGCVIVSIINALSKTE